MTLGGPSCAQIPVIIADDSPAMREGLARLIEDECDLEVTDSAATAADAGDDEEAWGGSSSSST